MQLLTIQGPINLGRNRLDFSAKFLFNAIQIEAIIVSDQVDSETKVAKPSRSSNSMEIGLSILGKVKIDYNIHRLDVNPSSKEVRANQMTGGTISELMEDSVSISLLHLGMDVKTAETKLCNFFRKKLHTINRVAKNNALVNFKFGEKSVKAVNLLSFFHEGIELGDSS